MGTCLGQLGYSCLLSTVGTNGIPLGAGVIAAQLALLCVPCWAVHQWFLGSSPLPQSLTLTLDSQYQQRLLCYGALGQSAHMSPGQSARMSAGLGSLTA